MSNDLNPFSNENPFTDPDIQRVTQTTQIAQESLDDYNPFSQPNVQSKPAAIIPTSTISSSPAENYQTGQLKPPAYSETSAQKLNLTDIEKQQQELNQRAAELDRREQLINNPTIGVKNFPPFPSWCPGPLKPCFYQDINLEIPIEFQRWVRLLFYLWIFHTFTLGFNIIAALVVFIVTGMGATFGYSILYFVLFTPCSYACWFRPAYKGFRTDSSMNFMIFFFVFFCQVIVNFIEAVGFVGSGFCGILLLIKVLGTTGVGNVVAGIFVLLATICFVAIAAIDILMLIKVNFIQNQIIFALLDPFCPKILFCLFYSGFIQMFSLGKLTPSIICSISTVLFSIQCILDLYTIIQIHRLYRNTGASFQKAQAEFATNVMSNKNVQNAAASVVTEGARSAMQSNSRGRF